MKSDSLKGMRVVVTGGAGFIGRFTVEALLEKGAEILIIDNLSNSTRDSIPSGVSFVEANINSDKAESALVEFSPHYAYHLAFNVSVPNSVSNPLIEEDSLIGSLRMLRAFQKGPMKKFVFASSEFLYGNPDRLPMDETFPVEPLAPYSVSKYAVENYVQFYGLSYAMPYCVLRYATVYGPRQKKGAMTDYIRQLHAGKQAEFWGDGTKTRDYLFVSDIVDANLLALTAVAPEKGPALYNVSSNTETSLNEVYAQLAKILGKTASPVYRPDRPAEQYRCRIDSSKFQKLTGWKPKVSLSEGLRLKVEDFIKNPC